MHLPAEAALREVRRSARIDEINVFGICFSGLFPVSPSFTLRGGRHICIDLLHSRSGTVQLTTGSILSYGSSEQLGENMLFRLVGKASLVGS